MTTTRHFFCGVLSALTLRTRTPYGWEQEKMSLAAMWVTVTGHTAAHRRSLEIAELGFAKIHQQMQDLIAVQFTALQQKLEQAGVSWTPERGLMRAQ